MSFANRLVRLYPPAWQARYADEFLAFLGERPLRAQQVIDIVSGAIDAWFSADVRRATVASPRASQGGPMSSFSFVCADSTLRYTRLDAIKGASAMIISALLFSLIGFIARSNGLLGTAEVLKSFALPASVTLSMPFWILKGQSRKAQAVFVSLTLAVAASILFVL